MLQIKDHKQSVDQVEQNSLRMATIPASRGLILDRNGTADGRQRDDGRDPALARGGDVDPSIKGTLASLTGLSVAKIRRTSPTRPTTRTNRRRSSPTRRPTIVEFIKLHPTEFPGVSVLDVSRGPTPWVATWAPRCSATSARSRRTRSWRTRRGLPDRLDDRQDRHRGLLRAVPARSRRHQHDRGGRQRQRDRHAANDPTQDRRLGRAQHRRRTAEARSTASSSPTSCTTARCPIRVRACCPKRSTARRSCSTSTTAPCSRCRATRRTTCRPS